MVVNVTWVEEPEGLLSPVLHKQLVLKSFSERACFFECLVELSVNPLGPRLAFCFYHVALY